MTHVIGPSPLASTARGRAGLLAGIGLLLLAIGACSSGRRDEHLPLPRAPEDGRSAKAALAELEPWIHPTGEPAEALYAGDTIAIEVLNHAEYSVAQKTIPADGMIMLSGLKDESVQAIGKTPQELERQIARKYEAVLNNPYVTVNVKGFATRVVYVMGAVNNTGKFSIPKDTRLTLLQALAEAGGFSEQADESGIRIRRYDRGSGHQRTSPRIDFDVLLQAGIDIPLRANDTIQVPKRTKLEVAIWGKGVQSPGTYAWRDGLTITRLIPMAGGLEKFADTGRVLILRREPDGQKTYRIDLDRVYANREPDFLLRPGDVVRIDDTFF